MNIERGMMRIRIVVGVISLPLIFFGTIYCHYGSKQASTLNSELDLKVKTFLNSQSSLDPSKPYVLLDENGKQIRVVGDKGPWLKVQLKWVKKYFGEGSLEDVLYGIKVAEQDKTIGFCFLGLSALLWGLFFAGRWIVVGFVS